MELPEIVDGIRSKGIPLNTAIGYGVLVTVVLIVSRMISSYAALVATLIFRRRAIPHVTNWKRRYLMPLLLGWTGMRGVVSLAAALSIPVTLDSGLFFPHRDLILFITFVAILLTLLVQGLTLPIIIERTHLFDGIFNEEAEEETRRKMKHGLKQHVYEVLKSRYESDLNGHAGIEKILKQWEDRAKASDDSWMNEKTKALFVELLECQRQYLTQLNKDPSIDEDIIRQQLYQIDLEEERLKII